MDSSPTESPDVIWNRKAVKWRLAGQTNRASSFFLLSLFWQQQSKPASQKQWEWWTTAWNDTFLRFSQNILIIYLLSHMHAQYLAHRRLVSCCCYFGWCNRVILPSDAMLKVHPGLTWWRWQTHLFLTRLEHIGPNAQNSLCIQNKNCVYAQRQKSTFL